MGRLSKCQRELKIGDKGRSRHMESRTRRQKTCIPFSAINLDVGSLLTWDMSFFFFIISLALECSRSNVIYFQRKSWFLLIMYNVSTSLYFICSPFLSFLLFPSFSSHFNMNLRVHIHFSCPNKVFIYFI